LEKQYRHPLKLEEIRPRAEEVKLFVKTLCKHEYTIKDARVRLFWETIRPIIDRADYYINYKVFSLLMDAKRNKSKKLIPFLGLYKNWKNDIGEILLETIFYAIDRLEHNTTDKIKEKIDSYYKVTEERYFSNGIETALAELNV
jgi:hypothetical protein